MNPTILSDWSELYYQLVADYFWEPKLFGRKPEGKAGPVIADGAEPPKRPRGEGWSKWKKSLREKEVPLNHFLSLAFGLAPQETIDAVLSSLASTENDHTPLQGFQLVSEHAIDSTLGKFTQPDFVFANSSEVLFLEMKVDSKSSVDQFAKYALAAERFSKVFPALKEARLLMLVKDTTFTKVWGDGTISKPIELREKALKHIQTPGATGALSRSLAKATDAEKADFTERAASMALSLRLATYETLGKTLAGHNAPDPTARKLINGVLAELKARDLYPRKE